MNSKKLFIVFLLSIVSIMPFHVYALDTCTVVESGSKNILVSDKDSITKEVEDKVNFLNKDYGTLNRYSYSILFNNPVSTKSIKNKSIIKVDTLFDDIDSASNYYNEIKVVSPYIKGESSISTRSITNKITSNLNNMVCTSSNCIAEITLINGMLGSNQTLRVINYNSSTRLGNDISNVTYMENGSVKYYLSYSDALGFATSYVPVREGYSFIKNNVVEVKDTRVVNKTYDQLNSNNSFSSSSDAQRALDNFKVNYPNATGSVKSNVVGTSVVEREESFTNKNNFDSRVNELEDNGVSVTTNTNVGEVSTVVKEISSTEELNDTISEYENEGYTVEYTYDTVTSITGNVEVIRASSTATKLSNGLTRYTFTNGTNFVLIKQGSGDVAMWTPEALSESDKRLAVSTYNSANNSSNGFSDGSTRNLSFDQVEFISGYKTFDLSYLGNGSNWGSYTFSINENTNLLELTCDSKKLSHTVDGVVSTSNTKNIYTFSIHKDTYTLKYNESINTYNYYVDANVNINEDYSKFKIVSEFKQIFNDYSMDYYIDTLEEITKYELSYEQYMEEIIESVDVNWIIYDCPLDTGSIEVVEIIPPITNVNVNNNYLYIILLTISKLMFGYMLLKSKQN